MADALVPVEVTATVEVSGAAPVDWSRFWEALEPVRVGRPNLMWMSSEVSAFLGGPRLRGTARQRRINRQRRMQWRRRLARQRAQQVLADAIVIDDPACS